MKKILPAIISLHLFIGGYAQTTQRWIDGIGSVTSGVKTAIASDLIGNIYTTGTVSGSGGTDWEIISYKPDGTTRWTMTLNGGGSGADVATGIAVDSAFNIYVCGYTVNSSSNKDITVRKIDSAGSASWTTNYTRSSTANDEANAIVVKGSYVYVTGKSENASSNYDCAILKLAVSDGSVSWASFFNGTASGLDVGNAIVVNNSAEVYVAGNTLTTSKGIDGMILKYAANGTKSWDKTAGGNSSDDLFSIALDASGNVYVTGYKTVSSGSTTDYITAKFNSSGTSQWGATYNGSYSGYDKAKALVIDGSGYIYVTGSSESASTNTDYLSICYSSSGSAVWTQRYNGPGNAEDNAMALLLDGTDVVVTGSSKNSSSNYDFTTLSYVCSDGTLSWTMRTDGSGTGADLSSGICRDEMGNIYVSGTIYIGSSSYELGTVKYNQLGKNELQIESVLQKLAYGFSGIKSNSAAKQIIYDRIILTVDSFTQVRIRDFLKTCADSSVTVKPSMNSAIASHYSLSSSYDWVEILMKQIYYQELHGSPMVYVESFFSFSESTFTGTTPEIAYTYFEDDYPFPSVTATDGYLSKSDATTSTSLNVIFFPGPWLIKSPEILICTATKWNPQCSVCSPSSTLGGLPWDTSTTGTQHHEIGIRTGFNYYGSWPHAPNYYNYDYCLDIYGTLPFTGSPLSITNYAILRALPGLPFYRRIASSTGEYARLLKIENPIEERFHYTTGKSMSLCEEFCSFHDLDESGGHYGLGFGGVYEISRPGSNFKPVYFYFPYSATLWYQYGPDMNIVYGTTYTNNNCSNGDAEILEDFFIGPCEVCGKGQTVLGMNSTQEHNVLATTDFAAITTYWGENAIDIGFNTGSGAYCTGNIYTLQADNNSSNDCNSSSYSSLPLVCQLAIYTSEGSYEVRQNFSTPVQSGSDVLVHVIAHFDNTTEYLDECFTMTLTDTANSPALDFVNAAVQIRGNISPYNSSAVNYEISIYQL